MADQVRHRPPPPRYRIVERDRRLVVVDNWATGDPSALSVRSTPFAPNRDPGLGINADRPALPGHMKAVAFDGRTAFTTHRLFDEKGPRTIILDPASAATINGVKLALIPAIGVMIFIAVVSPYLLLVPLIVLGQPRLRKTMRRAITAWLDRAAIDAA